MNRTGLIAALALVALAGVCGAAIINVPDDQQTIQAGIDAAEDGDTVLVQPGVYQENITATGKSNITIGSLTLMTGDSTYINETVIDGGGNGATVDIRRMQEGVRITLQGFTIRNGNSDYGGGVFAGIGISADLIDLVVTGNQGSDYAGIAALSITDAHFKRVKIIDNDGAGVMISGTDASLEDCEISNNRGTGGYIWTQQLSLKNMLFSDNEQIGLSLFGSLNQSLILNHLTIAGTRMVDDAGGIGLLLCAGNITHATLSNSIIYGNEGAEIQLQEDGMWADAKLAVSFCDVEGGQDSVEVIGDNEVELNWGDGNIDANPLFADLDSGDFHLTANSFCIDAGDPDYSPDPDGTRADMGAFYFHQRDIEVSPTEIHFPAIPWGETDSALASIWNVGRTTLHISAIAPPNFATCIWMLPAGRFDPPLEIAPESSMDLWFFYRPDTLPNSTSCVVFSDDPDEPRVFISADGEFEAVEGDDAVLPCAFGISGVYPNPFNSQAVSSYKLQVSSWVKFGLYDLRGGLVQTVAEGEQMAGEHRVTIDGAALASGVYIARLEAGGKASVRKIVCVK